MSLYLLDFASDDGSLTVRHLGGVPWYNAPIPRRWHRCWVQTDGWDQHVHHIERCACGATRYDGSGWLERNTRKRP